MLTFLDANLLASHTFVLYGNVTDEIWCPDLQVRTLEQYLVQYLKRKGYRYIIFFEGAGRGEYCLDAESACHFFHENEGVKIPDLQPQWENDAVMLNKQTFQKSRDSQRISLNQPHTQNPKNASDDSPAPRKTSSSTFSGLLKTDYGRRGMRGLTPGIWDQNPEQAEKKSGINPAIWNQNPERTEMNGKPEAAAGGAGPKSGLLNGLEITFGHRGMMLAEFVKMIHTSMLEACGDNRIAVIFSNIRTTRLDEMDSLKNDIFYNWERSENENLCLMIAPETENDRALANLVGGWGTKFCYQPENENQVRINPATCFRLEHPGKDEIASMLLRFHLIGTKQGRKIDLTRESMEFLAEEILAAAKEEKSAVGEGKRTAGKEGKTAGKQGKTAEITMREISRRVEEYLTRKDSMTDKASGWESNTAKRRTSQNSGKYRFTIDDIDEIWHRKNQGKKTAKANSADRKIVTEAADTPISEDAWSLMRICVDRNETPALPDPSVKELKDMEQQLHQERVGQQALKEKITERIHSLIYQKMNSRIQTSREPGHYFFMGAPGTGKTTSAELMAEYFYRMGLVTSLDLIKTTAADLIAGYTGQTYAKTKEVLEKAAGKVLLIDEAYNLTDQNTGKADSFKQDALTIIVAFLDDPAYRKNTSVIFAGYGKQMELLYSGNEGLRSRVTPVIFPNFTKEECLEILRKEIAEEQMEIDEKALVLCGERIEKFLQMPAFANGRTIRVFKDMLRAKVESRVVSHPENYQPDDPMVYTILEEDVPEDEEALQGCNL